jgi:hypothetical protein
MTNKLIIDRKVWMRGGGEGAGLLLFEGGHERQQCCVGIYLTSLGVGDNLLAEHLEAGETIPSSVLADLGAGWLIRDGTIEASQDALSLYLANDIKWSGDALRTHFPQAEGEALESWRERVVAQIFLKHGIEVEFIN